MCIFFIFIFIGIWVGSLPLPLIPNKTPFNYYHICVGIVDYPLAKAGAPVNLLYFMYVCVCVSIIRYNCNWMALHSD